MRNAGSTGAFSRLGKGAVIHPFEKWLYYDCAMKLRSQPQWPRSFDFLRSLTLSLTPEGAFQAVRVLKPGTAEQEGDFEVLFEGSREQCMAVMEDIVRRDMQRVRSGSGKDA